MNPKSENKIRRLHSAAKPQPNRPRPSSSSSSSKASFFPGRLKSPGISLATTLEGFVSPKPSRTRTTTSSRTRESPANRFLRFLLRKQDSERLERGLEEGGSLFSPRVGTLRALAAVSGTLVVALAALGLRDPLASMSSYTAALMALNQIAPPLLLLALPRTIRVSLQGRGKGAAIASLLLDPWAATTLFIGLSIAVSLPGVFDPSVANALYAAPLGALELLSGLLFWAQFVPATRRIRPAWLAGTVAWIGAMPMTVVAVVWMLSPDVLYTPYLDVICRWNIPPLVDQRWAGLVMFVAGVPVQLVGVWLLVGSSHRIDPATGPPTLHPPKRERA